YLGGFCLPIKRQLVDQIGPLEAKAGLNIFGKRSARMSVLGGFLALDSSDDQRVGSGNRLGAGRSLRAATQAEVRYSSTLRPWRRQLATRVRMRSTYSEPARLRVPKLFLRQSTA